MRNEVDLSAWLSQEIRSSTEVARQAESQGDIATAAREHGRLAKLIRDYASRYIADLVARQTWLDLADLHGRRAQQIQATPAAGRGSGAPPRASREAPAEETRDPIRAAVEALRTPSTITWSDVGGLDMVKKELKDSLSLAFAQRPPGFKYGGWERIRLVGPPGTGKTLLAAAAAGSMEGAAFFPASCSELTSKYFGESEKVVRTLFEVAREHSPSVVFIDEVDALARSRGWGGESEPGRRLLNTFLEATGGTDPSGERPTVLTFIATNVPWQLDQAVLSRFPKEVFVPLPDLAAREQVLRIHLVEKGVPLDAPLSHLSEMTEGYSGRDLAALCQQVVLTMVGRANPNLVDLVDQGGIRAVASHTILLRELTLADFSEGMQVIKPSVGKEEANRWERWLEERR